MQAKQKQKGGKSKTQNIQVKMYFASCHGVM